ncbi:MAG: hypothetical protein ABI318_17935 [Chthoniobacteraceae bacterium]
MKLTIASHPRQQWEAQPIANRVEQIISTLPTARWMRIPIARLHPAMVRHHPEKRHHFPASRRHSENSAPKLW